MDKHHFLSLFACTKKAIPYLGNTHEAPLRSYWKVLEILYSCYDIIQKGAKEKLMIKIGVLKKADRKEVEAMIDTVLIDLFKQNGILHLTDVFE